MKRTTEEIEQLLKDYRERGEMTLRAFCESRGVSSSTLSYYARRFGQRTTRLARVKVTAPAETLGRFSLVLGNGRHIECGEAELAELIRVAEGC